MLQLILSPHVGLIFWQTVVVLIAYFLLRKFAWGPILSFMEEQEEFNKVAATQAEEAKKAMERAEIKSQRTLDQAAAKKDRMLAKAMATKQAILAEAKMEAEEVRREMAKKAKQEIGRERKAALYAFKGEAGALVVHAAQKLIGRELQKEHVQHKVLSHMIEEALKETPQRTAEYIIRDEQK